MQNDIAQVLEALRVSENVLVTAHAQPDGDALGAMAGMAHLLARLGKRVAHYNVSHIPEDFRLLDMGAPWARTLKELQGFRPDLLVVLDCGDASRVGPELEPLVGSMRSVNIDHHMGNPRFGTAANWVDPGMVAAAQMVGYLARAAGFELSGILGECVYLGLNTDTGSFRFDSTTPEAFELAAEIVRSGLRLGAFFTKYEKHWTLNRLILWGDLMQHVQLHCGGRVALTLVTKEVIERRRARRGDLENFASFLHCLHGVDVVLLVRENGPGKSKASFRAIDEIDVQVMAAEFGGGGHKNASGAELDMEPAAAATVILETIDRHLARYGKKG